MRGIWTAPFFYHVAAGLLLLSCAAGPARAASGVTAEARAARAFAAAGQNPLKLHAFLEKMPKGADLHMHLLGAVYAETFLDEAAADGLCVNLRTLSIVPTVSPCPAGEVSGPAELNRNNYLRNELIDAFSMRGFVPSSGITRHDHFFSAFGRFEDIGTAHRGEWLDAVSTRAARQNEQYLEIMVTPNLQPARGMRHGSPGAGLLGHHPLSVSGAA